MASTAILAIRIISDATKAARELNGLSDSTGKWEARTQKASAAANKIGLGLAAAGGAAFKYASDLQQSTGAVESVFKKHADAVKRNAAGAAQAVGISTSEYQEFASVIGAQLGNMGVASDQLAGKSDKLIRTGADLAATFGGTTKEAVEALSSALRGETDPIERYGISIKEADIKAQLAAKGQAKLTGAAGKSAKAQAVLALIAKQGATAQGAFARESDTAAGQQQRATAAMKDAAAQIGQSLLPIVATLAEKLAAVAKWAGEHPGLFKAAAVGLAAFVVIAKVAAAATAVFNTVQAIQAVNAKRAAAGQRVLNLTMLANPIVLVVAAIVALVAIFVIAWKRSKTFRSVVIGAWNAIKKATGAVWGWVKDAIKKAFDFLKKIFFNFTGPGLLIKHWDKIKKTTAAAWEWVKTKTKALWAAITGAIKAGVSKAVGFVRDLPGKIKGFFSGAKDWLLDAGRKVIQGLLDGIGSMVRKLKDKLSGITDLFPKVKGPPSKDRRLLKPAGQMIMDGLIGGIQEREAKLRRTLEGVSGTIARGVNADPLARLAAAGAPLSGAATASTTGGDVFYIDARGAMDEDATARKIEQMLQRRARRVGRR